MISSREFASLLEAKNYQKIHNIVNSHFQGPDKGDVTSSQKLTNMIAFHIYNEPNLSQEILTELIKYFAKALEVLQESSAASREILCKVFEACNHVSTFSSIFGST